MACIIKFQSLPNLPIFLKCSISLLLSAQLTVSFRNASTEIAWKNLRSLNDHVQINFTPQDEIPLTEASAAASQTELHRTVTRVYKNTRRGEPPKVIYTTRRQSLNLLWSILVHIPPLFITIIILALNYKNVYWSDLGAAGQNLVLDSLQYAAKAHELMMTLSLGTIVLHRVQVSLLSNGGVPLGLVTAPYRLTDVYYLFSREFWAGATTTRSTSQDSRHRFRVYRWTFLGILIAVNVILAALVGPSSAVLMIPQLDWWDLKDPFHRDSETCFLNISAGSIWPKTVPDPWFIDPTNEYSVTAGLDHFAGWASAFENQLMHPNISVDADGGVFRYATSVPQEPVKNSGSTWTAASTVSNRQARDVGSFWEWVSEQELKPKNISRPILTPRLVNSTVAMQKPLVQIECAMYNLTNSSRGIEFPHRQLVSQVDKQFDDVHWPVPVQYLNTGWYDSTNGVSVEFIDVSNFTNASSAAAVYVLKDEWENFQLLPCSILAHWVPVSLWLDPRTDNLVYQDSPDPYDALNRSDYRNLNKTTQIVIPPSYASAINNASVSDPRPLAMMVKNFGVHYTPELYVIQGKQNIPWQVATTLGLYVADSLSRVNYLLNPNASVVVHDPGDGGQPFARILDNLNVGNLSYAPYDTPLSFYEANQDTTTAFSFEVQRFGYAWSTRNITVKLAATVLLCQAALAIGHLMLLLLTGWTSNS
ncbi:hypothetical protein NA57DRAFT_80382 [Rhizodiscina lignyota]|uniref:Uncharacterized protein n=1 Tax=Rhizodiscina lignyota TaxID=1504668 RepID=A0A9P4I3U2_9PEZI|nr:hypothetical protein NA57DRAFT_80382 [Rhizodiscina lignyota]